MTIRVVLADDHAVVRDGLRLLLEAQHDIEVAGTANDGREAVRRAVELNPDVVVMDIAMPRLNGIDAAQQILEQLPATAVVILSMYASAEYIHRALQAGVRGYVLKESAGAEVVESIRTVYRGERYFSDRVAENFIGDGESKRARSPLDRLTRREREILQLTAEGKSSAEAAGILALSPKTVETYRSRILHKLAIDNLPDLVKFAIQHGLISLE